MPVSQRPEDTWVLTLDASALASADATSVVEALAARSLSGKAAREVRRRAVLALPRGVEAGSQSVQVWFQALARAAPWALWFFRTATDRGTAGAAELVRSIRAMGPPGELALQHAIELAGFAADRGLPVEEAIHQAWLDLRVGGNREAFVQQVREAYPLWDDGRGLPFEPREVDSQALRGYFTPSTHVLHVPTRISGAARFLARVPDPYHAFYGAYSLLPEAPGSIGQLVLVLTIDMETRGHFQGRFLFQLGEDRDCRELEQLFIQPWFDTTILGNRSDGVLVTCFTRRTPWGEADVDVLRHAYEDALAAFRSRGSAPSSSEASEGVPMEPSPPSPSSPESPSPPQISAEEVATQDPPSPLARPSPEVVGVETDAIEPVLILLETPASSPEEIPPASPQQEAGAPLPESEMEAPLPQPEEPPVSTSPDPEPVPPSLTEEETTPHPDRSSSGPQKSGGISFAAEPEPTPGDSAGWETEISSLRAEVNRVWDWLQREVLGGLEEKIQRLEQGALASRVASDQAIEGMDSRLLSLESRLSGGIPTDLGPRLSALEGQARGVVPNDLELRLSDLERHRETHSSAEVVAILEESPPSSPVNLEEWERRIRALESREFPELSSWEKRVLALEGEAGRFREALEKTAVPVPMLSPSPASPLPSGLEQRVVLLEREGRYLKELAERRLADLSARLLEQEGELLQWKKRGGGSG